MMKSIKGKKYKRLVALEKKEFICTSCSGDATIAYFAKKKGDWDGLIEVGERLCLVCGRKRGIKFFG